MTEPLPPSDGSVSAPARGRNWNALSAIIASLIGLLALCVSGYTAYIQREQVRAQVWPNLIAGNDDNDLSLIVYSKGVGPAIVRSAQIWVDGKAQSDWHHVLDALGMKRPVTFSESTINPDVVSPGENVRIIKFEDKDLYRQFRAAAVAKHMAIAICYCSTLGECWNYRDAHLVGFKQGPLEVKPVDQCPRLPASEVFNN
ncbi:MAG TPA: hypothetical protein VF021_08635 [Longimicrobiales bacterium]